MNPKVNYEYERNIPHGLDVLILGNRHSMSSLMARVLDASGIHMTYDIGCRYGLYRGWGSYEDPRVTKRARAVTGHKHFSQLRHNIYKDTPHNRRLIAEAIALHAAPGLKMTRGLALWPAVKAVLDERTLILLVLRDPKAQIESLKKRSGMDRGRGAQLVEWARDVMNTVESEWPRTETVLVEQDVLTAGGRCDLEARLRERLPGFKNLFWHEAWD